MSKKKKSVFVRIFLRKRKGQSKSVYVRGKEESVCVCPLLSAKERDSMSVRVRLWQQKRGAKQLPALRLA
jgi:hypothetical protein